MLNLTRQEKLVIEFLLLFLIIGTGIRLYRERCESDSDKSGDSIAEFKRLSDTNNFENESKLSDTKSTKSTSSFKSRVKINLNTATKKELMSLPRIGEATAEKIIKYREEHGGFKSIDELKSIKGIGPKTFELIKGDLTIE